MNSSFDFCTLSELRRREEFHVLELQKIRDEIQRRESLDIDTEEVGFLTPEQIREKQRPKGNIIFPQDMVNQNEQKEMKITQKMNHPMKDLYMRVNIKQGRQQIQEELLKSHIGKPSKQIKRLRKEEEEDWEKARELIEDELPADFQKKLNVGIYREVSNSRVSLKPKKKIIRKKKEIDFGSDSDSSQNTEQGAGRAAPVQSILAPTHFLNHSNEDDDDYDGDDGNTETYVSQKSSRSIYDQSPLLNDLWK
jgi:hypothetical protein